MSTWFRAGVLVIAAVTFIGFSWQSGDSFGQEKKAAKTTGIVEVNEGKDGKFRLIIRDNAEKFLAQSAAFASKADAMKGLDSLKAAIENPKFVEKKAEKKKEKTTDK